MGYSYFALLLIVLSMSYLSMSIGEEEVNWGQREVEFERVKAKRKGLNPFFFLRATRKMPGNPGKKEKLEGSREVGGKDLIMHA